MGPEPELLLQTSRGSREVRVMGPASGAGPTCPVPPCLHDHTRTWALGTWKLVTGPREVSALPMGHSISHAGWKESQATLQGSWDLQGHSGHPPTLPSGSVVQVLPEKHQVRFGELKPVGLQRTLHMDAAEIMVSNGKTHRLVGKRGRSIWEQHTRNGRKRQEHHRNAHTHSYGKCAEMCTHIRRLDEVLK